MADETDHTTNIHAHVNKKFDALIINIIIHYFCKFYDNFAVDPVMSYC